MNCSELNKAQGEQLLPFFIARQWRPVFAADPPPIVPLLDDQAVVVQRRRCVPS